MPLGISAGTALLGSAALSGTSSLVGGKKGANAATNAANIQAAAAMQSAQLQQQRFEETKGILQPFVDYGRGAMDWVQNLTGTGPGGDPLTAPLTAPVDISQAPSIPGIQPWNPTMEGLAQTPGYQFALQQGLQATQFGQAASGLGRSGSALRGAGRYAEGLASTTYNQQFQNYLAQQQLQQAGGQTQFNRWLQQQQLGLSSRAQTLNMLTGQVGTGLSAAGALGGASIQSGQNVGTALQTAGNVQGAGIMGAAQSQIAGMSGAANAFANPLATIGMMGTMNQMGLFNNPSANTAGAGMTDIYYPNAPMPA